MLRVTIELIPFGNEDNKETIGEIIIINDATSKKRPEFGNYEVKLYQSTISPKFIAIKNHKREDGYLKLLQKCINKLVKNG